MMTKDESLKSSGQVRRYPGLWIHDSNHPRLIKIGPFRRVMDIALKPVSRSTGPLVRWLDHKSAQSDENERFSKLEVALETCSLCKKMIYPEMLVVTLSDSIENDDRIISGWIMLCL
ncbi:hypothetical protein ACLB2K_029698 [Fragaria x ananassa]